MRKITSHVCTEADEQISVTALDAPGPGGAHHHYGIDCAGSEALGVDIHFQNGPVAEAGGVNGITIEALMAVCIDRLECFQSGPFACAENAVALNSLRLAMTMLHGRTVDRAARRVEGRSKA